MGRFHSVKICETCHQEFIGGHTAKWCSDCHPGRFSSKGVGSGGNQLGEHNHRWKGNWMSSAVRKQVVREAHSCCENCATNLSEYIGNNYKGKNGWWVIDHKNGERSHNGRNNLQLLCKRCHQVKHKCAKTWGAQASKIRWNRIRTSQGIVQTSSNGGVVC